MALSVRKKNSPIFSIPSYLPAKKSKINDKVDKLIQETIQEKIFNLLNINRKTYIKLVEYFSTYTLCKISKEKTVASFNLRIKSKYNNYFKKITAQEIKFSGVTVLEFDDFLKQYNASYIKDINSALSKI
jgi:hypothetical protein|tara:strand:+ start:1014 stop:1403 length:390 start_codon:yes stop_codon:yes gene_type:complete